MREEPELAVTTRLKFGEQPRYEAPNWMKERLYALGAEPGSGAIDFWDDTDQSGTYEGQMACRVAGVRYEVHVRGTSYDETALGLLAALEKELTGDDGAADTGVRGPVS